MKYENNHKFSILLLLLAGLMSGCQKDFIATNTESYVDTDEPESLIKLGEELEIPYTSENMSKAFNQVLAHLDKKSPYGKSRFATKSSFSSKTSSAKNIEIVPSHYYYRFLPKDSLEYETLVNDTILNVTNVPMHLEVLEEGDVYDDPTIDGDEIGENFGWLYSVLPYDYDFPKYIENELLENMYFAPELDDDEPLAKGEIMVKTTQNKTTKDLLTVDENGEVFEYIELEALKLTNNLDEEELKVLRFYLPNDDSGTTYTFDQATKKGFTMPELILDYDSVTVLFNSEEEEVSKGDGSETARWWRRRKWSPSGRITVEEGVLTDIGSRRNIVGVMGAEVKVRKWGFLVIRRARTDRAGNFRTRGTRTKRVKYAVYFNSPGNFVVKAGTVFWNARHRGHRRYKRSGWFQHFSEGGRSHFYSLVQNAAYDYYTRAVPRYGLKRPRYCKLSAKYNRCASSQHRPGLLSNNAFVSDIRITRRNGNCNYRQSDGIYATTVHELTHAGHRQMDQGMFSVFESGSCNRAFLKESWAEGVETIVTNDRYRALDRNYFRDANDDIGWNYLRQTHSPNNMTEYTPIVADLVDNLNQNDEYSDLRPIPPIDRVHGYRLNQIQRALDNCRDIDCWERNLRNLYDNSTEGNLTELFNYMRDARNNNNPNKCN